jgi:branched-chain amino acid transport system permease protein
MLRTLLLMALIVAVALGLGWAMDAFRFQIGNDVIRIINLAGIAIILAVSLNVINGLCGQFSLGHAGFMLVGAYVCLLFTSALPTPVFDPEVGGAVMRDPLLSGILPEQIRFPLGLLLGGLAAAVAGLLVGIPTLRLRGDYLAIATLGFGEIARVMVTNMNTVGGARGLTGLPAHTTPAWIFAIAGICVLFSVNLQRSTWGRALIAIRENELAAEVMGVRVARMKVMAFVYGAFFAGIAGGLSVHLATSVSPKSFEFMKSVEIVVMLVLGGLGSLTGAIIGAILLTILPEALRDVERLIDQPGLRWMVYSLILILLMIFRPQGIFGQKELSLKLLRSLIPGNKRDT